MAESNLVRVRAAYDAFNRGDVEAALAHLHDDVEWHMSGEIVGTEDSYHGHDGVRRWWLEFMEPFEALAIEPEEIVEFDDARVLVRVRLRARGRQGIEVDLPVSHLYEFRDGKVARVQAFRDHDEALAAAER